MQSNQKVLITALVGVLALLVVGVFLWNVLTGSEEIDEHGHHDHGIEGIDPVRDDPENAAIAAVSTVWTLYPAEQESALDSSKQIEDRLTGKYLQWLNSADPEDELPDNWDIWADAGDVVKTVATPAKGSPKIGDNDEEGTVVLDVSRMILHADGTSTPYSKGVVNAHMIIEDDMWKLERLEYVSVQY